MTVVSIVFVERLMSDDDGGLGVRVRRQNHPSQRCRACLRESESDVDCWSMMVEGKKKSLPYVH